MASRSTRGSSDRSDLTPLQLRIVAVIELLGPGEVVSYGDVAHDAGAPGAARAVGNVCASVPGLPWWRVVNACGRLVPGHETDHAARLRAEGVRVERGRVRSARFGSVSSDRRH
jgi:methylated-DNA-protein-cysteine methyltransferase related protein